MTNVMIVEDQVLTQRLFELMVRSSDGYRVSRTIDNADMAPVYCEHEQIDLILMNVCTANDANGLEAAEKIKKKYPNIKIIIVTAKPEFSWLDRARQIGADSFWYKNCSGEPLPAVMERTMRGERIYPAATPEVSIGCSTNHAFSQRELEVLRELTTGASNAEIGKILGVSDQTVKTHVANLMSKTGFRSRTELAVEARRLGITIKDKGKPGK